MVAITASFQHLHSASRVTDRTTRAAASREEALHDTVLVRRFNEGDESAFIEIVTYYQEKVVAVAYSVLRDRTDAEEVAQDTFMRAYRSLANFRGDCALYTWLHRIALNLARNRYWYFFRRNRHTTQSLDNTFGDDNHMTLANFLVSDAPSPVQEITTNEFSELIAVCMEQLGPGHREILTQRGVMNCSYDKIAQNLGINVGTVKSRVARARSSLRELLAKTIPGFAEDKTSRRAVNNAGRTNPTLSMKTRSSTRAPKTVSIAEQPLRRAVA